LTFKGQKIASESKKRHNIVYNFLLNLGLDKNTASADAEGIEHHVSQKTLRKMDNFNSKK
jgi:DtxR family manganese transport transcriptional regulator